MAGPERTSGEGPGPTARAGDGWIDALVRAAEGAGIGVEMASARDGVLTLRLRTPDGAIGVDVLPRAPRDRYHVATARFGLRHHGRAAPAGAEQDALLALARAIRAVEPSLPASLAAGAAGGGSGAAAAGAALFTVERSASATDGGTWTELLVRLTARCNQRCPFCSGPPDHPDAEPERVRAWLDDEVPRHPRPSVTLTGGEPGLWAGLPELARHLLARPEIVEVRVQTNAVPFARPERAAAFAADPRLRFFVSFHAARPELYDLCTGTRGQLELAVAGIRNLIAREHALTLNVVAGRLNAGHLEEWVAAVAELFPAAPRPRLHFSITMCPEHRPGAPEWLVRYTELAPRLAAAVARARALGLACDPLLASSHAALPPCVLPDAERSRGVRADGAEAVPVHRPDEAGIEDLSRPWVKSAACLRCSETARCLGVPRAYAARFGLSELRALR